MIIYRLKELISTDDKGRPCKGIPQYVGLPGVDCKGEPGSCGQLWATTMQRIRKELPTDHPVRIRGVSPPASPREMELLISEVRSALGLPTEQELLPGTDIGLLHIDCTRNDIHMMEWPGLHSIVTREDFRQILVASNLTGWDTAPIIITKPPIKLPHMDELIVTGRGGKPVTTPPVEVVSSCPLCRRKEYKKVDWRSLEVDETQWDGSDIFRFDPPFAGYIFVTERWVEAMKPYRFEGFQFTTAAEFLAELSKFSFPYTSWTWND